MLKAKQDELIKIKNQNKKLRKRIKELERQLVEETTKTRKVKHSSWPSDPNWLG
jgi:hypothetical protein